MENLQEEHSHYIFVQGDFKLFCEKIKDFEKGKFIISKHINVNNFFTMPDPKIIGAPKNPMMVPAFNCVIIYKNNENV